MKILIIEDNEQKFNTIVNALKNLEVETEITHKVGMSESLREIYGAYESKNLFDLIITDNNFPQYVGESPVINNGRHLIKRVEHRCGDCMPICMCSSDLVNVEDFNSVFYNIIYEEKTIEDEIKSMLLELSELNDMEV